MNEFLADILTQPAALRGALSHYFAPETMRTLAAIGGMRGREVIFSGMGSSHYSCYSAALCLREQGLACRVASASALLHYEPATFQGSPLLVLVSQSGESVEIVKLLAHIGADAKLIAVTNNPVSTLAQRADYVLNMRVAPEKSVASRTYLASLILTLLLARALSRGSNAQDQHAFAAAVDGIQHGIETCQAHDAALKAFLPPCASIVLIARGYNLGTAYAGALFLQEVSKLPAYGIDAGEFRHGPLEIVDEAFRGIVFAPSGKTCALNISLARDIAAHGGKVVLITDTPVAPEKNILPITVSRLPEHLSPIPAILPVQFLDNLLAEQRGWEPGSFRWTGKITTRE